MSGLYLGSKPKGQPHRRGNTPDRDYPIGEHHPSAKLTAAKVADMLRRYWRDGESIPALARAFEVGRSTVHKAVHGYTWRREYRAFRRECEAQGIDPFTRPDGVDYPKPKLAWSGLIEIVEWHESDPAERTETVVVMAKRLGVSANTVYRVLRFELHAEAFEEIGAAIDAGQEPRELEPWW